MIYIGSILNVSDNSGVKKVKCIKVLKCSTKKWGKIGSFLIVVIKSVKILNKMKKKDISKAILVRTKKNIKSFDGSYISFNNNAVLLLNNKLIPIGTRVFGPISKELRTKKNSKLISLASKIV